MPKIFTGRAEDRNLEQLLGNIAEWLINNDLPSWPKVLAEYSNMVTEQIYNY